MACFSENLVEIKNWDRSEFAAAEEHSLGTKQERSPGKEGGMLGQEGGEGLVADGSFWEVVGLKHYVGKQPSSWPWHRWAVIGDIVPYCSAERLSFTGQELCAYHCSLAAGSAWHRGQQRSMYLSIYWRQMLLSCHILSIFVLSFINDFLGYRVDGKHVHLEE